MVKLVDLKKRQKVRFLKESETIANKYSKLVTHHMVSNFQKFANECFNLVEKYTSNKPLTNKSKTEAKHLNSSDDKE